jgi:hypothetical protein
MRVRLLEGSGNRARRQASGRRFQRSTFRRKRADDIQTMGYETTKTDAPPRATAILLFPTVCPTLHAENRLATAPRQPSPGSSSRARHERARQRRRRKQQLWSKKSSCGRLAASVVSAQRSLIRKSAPRNRVRPTQLTARAPLRRGSIALHMTRHRMQLPCSRRSRGERQPGSIQPRSVRRAAARVPRKLLRVQCLSDKLGYLRAAFLSPSFFLHQP